MGRGGVCPLSAGWMVGPGNPLPGGRATPGRRLGQTHTVQNYAHSTGVEGEEGCGAAWKGGFQAC